MSTLVTRGETRKSNRHYLGLDEPFLDAAGHCAERLRQAELDQRWTLTELAAHVDPLCAVILPAAKGGAA